MASLPSSRKADPRHFFQLGLALAVGLGQGTPVWAATAAAQDIPASAPARAEQDDQAQDKDAPALPPEPVPVPRTLDDLIPPEAVVEPDRWAADGAGNRGDISRETNPSDGADSLPPSDSFADFLPPPPPGLQPALDAAFAEFAIEVPEPLPADPAIEALASIAAPTLDNLPDLAEYRVNDALVLAFPVGEDAFPERRQFIARFRELSTLRELDDRADTMPQVAARSRADAALLGDILRTYGYYNGEVVRQLSGGRRELSDNNDTTDDVASKPGIRFDILPGTRYQFGRVALGALPDLPEPDATRLIAAFGVQPGDPLYADRIIDRELELRVALGESGYPFATLADPELLIDHARSEGDLTLDVQPGGKYVFGEVISNDPRFLSGRHLGRIARFDSGDVFQQSLETDLRRAIIATGLVSSVTITPRETRAPAGGELGEVALDVGFERAPLRTIAGAIGYGTEDGFKLETRWEHRNLFPPEGALRLRSILGTREALASIGVRRNNFRGRDQVLNVDLFASDITTEAVDSRGFGLRGAFEKVSNLLFQKPLSWQIGGELLYTDERNRRVKSAPGGPLPRRSFLIGGLFGSVTIDASDDLLDPSTGYRATMYLAPELSRSQATETVYLRAQGDASYYQPVGSTVLAGRVRVATIQGALADDIAPSRRLYAGGGASVRGFGFQGVGPRDAFGNPIGGASLVEFALEARVKTPLFDGAVQVVPFVDAGSVARGSTPDFADIRLGAGLGIRYKTTFGPIRVDVATPLNPTAFDSPVVVYVSFGQAF